MNESDEQEAAKLKNVSAVELVPPAGNVVTGESEDDADNVDDKPGEPGSVADERMD